MIRCRVEVRNKLDEWKRYIMYEGKDTRAIVERAEASLAELASHGFTARLSVWNQDTAGWQPEQTRSPRVKAEGTPWRKDMGKRAPKFKGDFRPEEPMGYFFDPAAGIRTEL